MCRLTPIKASLPFLVGGLFHDGLEKFYDGKFKEQTFRKYVQDKIEAAMEAATSSQESELLWVQEIVVMGMLSGYIERYAKQDKVQWKIIAPETDFTFKLQNGMTYAGKRDLLVESRKTPGITLVEHKTTGYITPGYIAKLPLDNQIQIYCVSVEKEYGKLPKRVIYNIIKKPGIRQKQNESFEQYRVRVEQEYKDNLTSYFYREVVPISSLKAKEHSLELEKCACEIQRAIKEGYYYKNTTQCTSFGNCPFMPLCLKQPLAINGFNQRESLHSELSIQGEKDD